MGCCFSSKNKLSLNSGESLLEINNVDIELFSFNNYECMGKIVDVYDGDTFTACFKFNDTIIKHKFRTLGYDSPEIKPLKSEENRDLIKKNAVVARDAFKYITECEKKLVLLKMHKFDKYGRILVTVFQNKVNINKWMIENGYGIEYNGGTKEKVKKIEENIELGSKLNTKRPPQIVIKEKDWVIT